MERLGTTVKRLSVSGGSPPTPAPTKIDETNLPPAFDAALDTILPSKIWSGWIPADGGRAIVRALTDQERAALQRRSADLAPALAPYQGLDDKDRVMIALADLFASFRSMRDKGADAAGILASAMRALEPFPAWAIEKACKNVQAEGYEVDGKRERHWPPSDAEIVVEVKKAERLRREALESALALLAAPVEEAA